MDPQLGPEEILYETIDDASLYDRFGRAIFAYVRLSLSSREDAEDLTLEVFTTALEQNNLAYLSASEQLAWLRRVAHNRFIDRYRLTARHPLVELNKVVERLFADETSNPEEIILQQERYGQLLHAAGRNASPAFSAFGGDSNPFNIGYYDGLLGQHGTWTFEISSASGQGSLWTFHFRVP